MKYLLSKILNVVENVGHYLLGHTEGTVQRNIVEMTMNKLNNIKRDKR